MIIARNNHFELGISEKADGAMNSDDVAEHVAARREFFSAYGIDPESVVSLKQVHGNQVKVVGATDAGQRHEGCDALITAEPGVCLAVTVDDCLPVFLYSVDGQAGGIVHAGWRGVVQEVVPLTVKAMQQSLGSLPETIKAYIGPHIHQCHFEIKQDVLLEFARYDDYVERRGDLMFVDLSGIVRSQLVEAGLNPASIEESDSCTYCNDRFFSRRQDGVDRHEAQVAYLYMQK